MSNNKEIKLSWEEFVLKGDPNSVDDTEEQNPKKQFKSKIKVHYEKKGRGGKEALIIRGFDPNEQHDLTEISKLLKSKIGVGGSVKDNEIIVQGNQRDKVVDILINLGFRDVKKAGG